MTDINAEPLTKVAIYRAVREFPEGARVILYVAADSEDRARRALGAVRPQTGDERRRPGAQDAQIDGRHVDIEVDGDLEDGDWSLSERVV